MTKIYNINPSGNFTSLVSYQDKEITNDAILNKFPYIEQCGFLTLILTFLGLRCLVVNSATIKMIKTLDNFAKLEVDGLNVVDLMSDNVLNQIPAFASCRVSIRPSNAKQYNTFKEFYNSLQCNKTITEDLPPYQTKLKGFKDNQVKFVSEMSFFDNAVMFGAGDISYPTLRMSK